MNKKVELLDVLKTRLLSARLSVSITRCDLAHVPMTEEEYEKLDKILMDAWEMVNSAMELVEGVI